MKEVLQDWEEDGFDYSNKACEYITKYHELMKNPYIADQINKYLRFCKSYDGGNVQDENRKYLMFEDFLNKNNTRTIPEQIQTFAPKATGPIFETGVNSNLNSLASLEVNSSVGKFEDVTDLNTLNQEESEDDFFENFMNE